MNELIEMIATICNMVLESLYLKYINNRKYLRRVFSNSCCSNKVLYFSCTVIYLSLLPYFSKQICTDIKT